MFKKFERKSAPLLGTWDFALRVVGSSLISLGITTASLVLGAVGYAYFGDCTWLDSFHNAAMILSGMGLVTEVKSDAGKLFSTFYCLYSGIVYLSLMAILLAPFYHRMLHHFHLEEDKEE